MLQIWVISPNFRKLFTENRLILVLVLNQILNVKVIVVAQSYCCLLLVLNSNNNNFA